MAPGWFKFEKDVFKKYPTDQVTNIVYTYLAVCADDNIIDKCAKVSYRSVAVALKIGRRSAISAIERLRTGGFISVQTNKQGLVINCVSNCNSKEILGCHKPATKGASKSATQEHIFDEINQDDMCVGANQKVPREVPAKVPQTCHEAGVIDRIKTKTKKTKNTYIGTTYLTTPDVIEVAEYWNTSVKDLPKIRTAQLGVLKKRIDSVKKVIELFGIDDCKAAIDKVSRSDFLNGRSTPRREGEKPFTAKFDWLMKVENITKVLEGNYDNKKTRVVVPAEWSMTNDEIMRRDKIGPYINT